MNKLPNKYGVYSPCLECKDRHLACHSECEKYKAFKTELSDAKKSRRNKDYIIYHFGSEAKKVKARRDYYKKQGAGGM